MMMTRIHELTTSTVSKKILIVAGGAPSHPYACAKLATVLANVHEVTLAGPNGAMLSRLEAEASRYNDSSEQSKIKCVSIGNVVTKVAINVRPVVDPTKYSPLKIIFDTLFKKDYNPFGIADAVENMIDDQMSTYENIKRMLPDFDLVIPIHSCAPTVCDAVESLQLEGCMSVPQCMVFSSLPYDNMFFRNAEGSPKMWHKPRAMVALPHVALYNTPQKVFTSYGIVVGMFRYLLQLFWMALDTYHVERAWKKAATRNDARRFERGLPAVFTGYRYYWQSYPFLSFGGTAPFTVDGDFIANNAIVVGSIQSTYAVVLGKLDSWINHCHKRKLVYVSFGTGTQLSLDETANLAKMALHLTNDNFRVLISLRKSEQERLGYIFENVMSSVKVEDGVIESNNGLVRMDADVPQENLLLSNKVAVFVSHMGFGGYSEGIRGGVPFICYPSGCDQFYNASRAIEAGIAIKAAPKMVGLESQVRFIVDDEAIKKRALELASDARSLNSNTLILDKVARLVDEDYATDATSCSDES